MNSRAIVVAALVVAGLIVSGCAGKAPGAAEDLTVAASRGSGDVVCGPVTAGNGKQVTLIAKATPAGTVGCTEAFDVITEYYERAAAESEGSARSLTVQGWSCTTVGTSGCEKNGLALLTR